MLLDHLIPRPLSREANNEGVTLLHNLLTKIHLERREARAVGWRGFLPSCAETYAWTAKVANSDWVFGMVFVGEESDESCLATSFDLYAFPPTDKEEGLPKIFQETVSNPEYTGMVRALAKNFDKLQAFRFGQLVLAARLDKTGFSFLLQTYPNVAGATSRDLRPLRVLLPLFACLVKTAGYVFQEQPELSWYKDPEAPSIEAVFGSSVFEEDDQPKRRIKQIPLSYQPDEIDSNRKPIIHVLCGFLGAGKTTFLQNWLNFLHTRERFTGVIQNEFGEVDLDAAILGSETKVEALNEGCVCCSLADSLRPGILRLIETTPADQIILETTGLANPDNILKSLDELNDIVNSGLVITVVDTQNLIEHPEYFEDHLRLSQIKRADVLICSKAESLPHEKLCELEGKLKELNPLALMLFAKHGATNFAALDSFFNHWLDKKYGLFTSHRRDPEHYSLLLTNHGARLMPQRGTIYETFVLNLNEPIALEAVEAKILSCGSHVLRAKGVIDIIDKGRCEVQFTDGLLNISAAEDSFPIEGSKLTIIGRGLSSPVEDQEIRRVRCL